MVSFNAVKTFKLTSVTFCTSVTWDTNNNTKEILSGTTEDLPYFFVDIMIPVGPSNVITNC